MMRWEDFFTLSNWIPLERTSRKSRMNSRKGERETGYKLTNCIVK